MFKKIGNFKGFISDSFYWDGGTIPFPPSSIKFLLKRNLSEAHPDPYQRCNLPSILVFYIMALLRYNSHIIQFILSKCTSQCFSGLRVVQPLLVPEYFHHPSKKLSTR